MCTLCCYPVQQKYQYMDIYDDSMWLINLVENLLAVTRIEEGRLNLRITEDLMDDVITEALPTRKLLMPAGNGLHRDLWIRICIWKARP